MAYSEPLIKKKTVIQAKIEAVKGTAETTGLTDCLVFDPDIKPTAPFIGRNGPGLYLGNANAGVIGERSGSLTFSAEVRGNGSTGMDAGLAVLLQGCGLKKTSEVYQVSSAMADHSTLTIFVFEDGKKKILHGAMGNVTFEGETGKRLMANFEFFGIWNAPTDVALPAFTPGTESPPILASGTFTVASNAKLISRLSLNMGNNVVMRPDINATSGIAHYCITDIDPVLGFDLEAELVATYDIYGAWLAGTEAAVSLVLGSGAGKEITFTIPALQYRELPEGEREGKLIYDATGQCNHSSGDDAVAISVATS